MGGTAKAAAKWPKMIGFWIFRCLWNHLIKTLLAGGPKGPPKPSAGARKRGAIGPPNFLVY